MHYVHNLDPVALQLGPLSIHWYGLMYICGFGGAWLFNSWRLKHYKHLVISQEHWTDFLTTYAVLGIVLGGRMGYVFFYSFSNFLDDPLFLFRVWEGGMSFHGGAVGVLVATVLYSRKHGIVLGDFYDFHITALPVGLFFGRIGNFIGGELWGHTSQLPWAVIFPSGGPEPRHPSQLYEAFLEGIVIWLLLWWFNRKPRPRYITSGLFMILYALFRGLVELVRQPDAHIGYLYGDFVTMGMLLSLPMLVLGVLVVIYGSMLNQYPKVGRTTSPASKRTPAKRTNKKRR